MAAWLSRLLSQQICPNSIEITSDTKNIKNQPQFSWLHIFQDGNNNFPIFPPRLSIAQTSAICWKESLVSRHFISPSHFFRKSKTNAKISWFLDYKHFSSFLHVSAAFLLPSRSERSEAVFSSTRECFLATSTYLGSGATVCSVSFRWCLSARQIAMQCSLVLAPRQAMCV